MRKIGLLIILVGCCAIPFLAQQSETKSSEEKFHEDIFVKASSLSLGEFTVSRRTRKVDVGVPSGLVELNYATLEREGKVVTTFDGNIIFGAGNSIDFGLFNFLANDHQQLLVAQRIPRGGAFWISDLSSDGKIIFDSTKWGVGREELQVIDIDADGVSEIILPITMFYGFEGISSAETPLPIVVFKYDPKQRSYFPANLTFRSYLLRDIENRLDKLEASENRTLSAILDVVMNYMFVGESAKGWSLFEKYYLESDRSKIKNKIQAMLEHQPAYRFLNSHMTRSN